MDSRRIITSCLNTVLVKIEHLRLTKFDYENLLSLFVSQLNSVSRKTHETLQEKQYAYR